MLERLSTRRSCLPQARPLRIIFTFNWPVSASRSCSGNAGRADDACRAPTVRATVGLQSDRRGCCFAVLRESIAIKRAKFAMPPIHSAKRCVSIPQSKVMPVRPQFRSAMRASQQAPMPVPAVLSRPGHQAVSVLVRNNLSRRIRAITIAPTDIVSTKADANQPATTGGRSPLLPSVKHTRCAT